MDIYQVYKSQCHTKVEGGGKERREGERESKKRMEGERERVKTGKRITKQDAL